MPEKFKFAFMPSASCGGCEIAVVDIDEVILKVAELADIVYWPTALDFKDKDLEAIPDGGVTVGFFNGAVRNDHDVHHAHLMRQKSQVPWPSAPARRWAASPRWATSGPPKTWPIACTTPSPRS
jgi:coenzyme F420-reducing hydrogenase gamma subunit